jgi:hypothetical protein
VLIVLLAATTLPAQTSRGTVTGVVTDPSGAVVPNAKVTLTQKETNVTRETATNSAGLYRFDAVNLGTYQVKISAAGFSNANALGIEVRANQTSTQDFTLTVGSQNQTVEVAADAAAVQLQTDEQLRGANIGTRALTDLPISGQNSLNLMTTVAGIIPSNNGVADSGVGSVNGSRTRANNFLIDGVDNNDISVAGPAVVMGNNDAIQEVSIQTANFSAEFGRSGGAVVNQVTKSGTNKLHGTLAWVYKSEVLDGSTVNQGIKYRGDLAKYNAKLAANQDPGKAPVLKPSYKEHIPAFTVGGPVYIPGVYDGHNKTFWFAAGQWDHYSTGAAQASFTVPTAAGISVLQGLAAKCPNAALYLKALNGLTASNQTGILDISVPNAAYTAGSTCDGTQRLGAAYQIPYGTGVREVPQNLPSYNMQFRVDHVINEKQNVSVRYFTDTSSYPNYYTGISRPFDSDEKGTDHSLALTHTYVMSNSMTNELRVNYVRMSPVWTVVDSTGLGTLPTFTYGTLSGFGTSANYPQGRTANTYQMQDVVTKIYGHHQFRMGGEFFDQIARQSAPITVRGAVAYSQSGKTKGTDLVTGFANFLDDFSGPGNAKVSRQYGTPKYHPSYTAMSGFFQDNWKVRPNFTLNLGIRYDYLGQPANIFPYPAVNFDATSFSKAKIPTDKNNFGPSVGFAYSPKFGFFEDGKTVIRGGFQVSYDRYFNNLLSNMAAGTPNNPSNVPVDCNSKFAQCTGTGRGFAGLYSTYFPAMTNGGVNPISDASSQFTLTNRNPYTERWSLGIQRELPAGMVMDLSYVGSASHKLFQQQQLNPNGAPVATVSNGNTTYAAGPRINPLIGGRVVRNSAANSNYNGMQLEVKKRYTETPLGAIQLTSAYTWSHSLGMIDEVFATYSSNATMMTCNPLRYNGWRTCDYGNSDNDRRHRWVSTVVWDIRGPKTGILGQAFGGWTVSGVVPIQSSTPFTVFNGLTNSVDRDLDGSAADRPDVGNPNAPLGTMAQKVNASVCSTGWQNIYGTGCVSPTDVRWLYYPTGSYAPSNPTSTAHRNSVFTKTGSILANVDIIKRFKIREGLNLEYRAEIFNVANQRNYNFVPLNTSLSAIAGSRDSKNGYIPSLNFLDYSQTDSGNRSMRMGLKVIF